MRNLFVLGLLLASFTAFGQVNLADINFNRIPFKKVREYIAQQLNNEIKNSDDLSPSFAKQVIPKNCSKVMDTYTIPVGVDDAWHAYSTVKPEVAWNGRKVRMGVLINKQQQTVAYPDENCACLNIGQVVYLNMKLMRGLSNISMAFEIINIDVEKRIIEFSYIKGNASQGKQQLIFSETKSGETLITHISYFKSQSKFRDKYLYPFFHKRATNEFHKNMARTIADEIRESTTALLVY